MKKLFRTTMKVSTYFLAEECDKYKLASDFLLEDWQFDQAPAKIKIKEITDIDQLDELLKDECIVYGTDDMDSIDDEKITFRQWLLKASL